MVSIIVPVYNTARYLERCIRSILNQSYSDLEVILVDDGSSDGSGEICDVFVQADNRVHCIHNGNNGVSYSRNCGLAVAEGGYIAFCDSDDYYSQDYLEKMRDYYCIPVDDSRYCWNFQEVANFQEETCEY